MNFWFELAVIVIIVFFSLRLMLPVKGVQSVDTETFKTLLNEQTNPILIDVREQHEFKHGSIKNAKNMPLSQFSAQMTQLDKEQPVFIFCQSGMRSKRAATLLVKAGFKKIIELKGGFSSWR